MRNSTALKEFAKLESPGLWREGPELRRRDVIVAFGEASLTLSDPRSELALSHWSLPAVERLNPGELPALYAPGRDALETLELEDELMIGALERVRLALAADRPRPGRLRTGLILATVLLVLGLGAVFVPRAVVNHTAAMLPDATRRAIGQMALSDLSRVAGAPCGDPSGLAALERLTRRLFGIGSPQRLIVLRDGTANSLSLPGHIITLNRRLVEDHDSPDIVAGFALAEAQRAAQSDAMVPLLHHAGLDAAAGLLTSGTLDPASVDGYGRVVMLATPEVPQTEALLARFATAGLPSTPYAKAIDPTGEATLRLIEADPYARRLVDPVLTDSDWISLQAICAE